VSASRRFGGMNAEGWFPDPEQRGRLRYFDGTVWLDQCAEEKPATPASTSWRSWFKASRPAKKSNFGRADIPGREAQR
jgi:hypothetical protein